MQLPNTSESQPLFFPPPPLPPVTCFMVNCSGLLFVGTIPPPELSNSPHNHMQWVSNYLTTHLYPEHILYCFPEINTPPPYK